MRIIKITIISLTLAFWSTSLVSQCSGSGQCEICDIVATINTPDGVSVQQGSSTSVGNTSAGGTATLSTLEVTATECGEISFNVDLTLDWFQGTSSSWIHGVSFISSAGWSAAVGVPPADAGWIFLPGGITGLCSGNTYGAGYYYDPVGTESFADSGNSYDAGNYSSWDGMMCSMTGALSGEDTSFGATMIDISLGGFIDDGDPSDNWGVNCGFSPSAGDQGDCPPFGFELSYCPSTAGTVVESITFAITEDGESGGWGSNAGCNYDIVIPVTINNAGVALPIEYSIDCGDCVDLVAGSNCSSYTWFNDDTNMQIASGSGNGAATVQVCPTEDTNYSVQVSGSCGNLTAQTTVMVSPCPTCEAEAGTPTSTSPICPGSDITASVSGNNTDVGYSTLYIFTDGDNILSVNSSGSYAAPTTCGVTYTVYTFNYDESDNTVTIPSAGDNISGINCDPVSGSPCCHLSLGVDVLVDDTELPVLDASPVDVTVCVGNVPPMVSLNWTDNCDGSGTVSGTDMTDGASCPEIITRSWTYTDACGNTATETQSITVGDIEAPMLDASPVDVTVCVGNVPPMVSLNWTDNCDGNGTVSGTDMTDGASCPEIITRSWTYTDACGNTATETQSITVGDIEAPMLDASPVDVTVCVGNVPPMVSLNWTDNCDGNGTVSGTDMTDGASCPEIITRSWTYTDACGNIAIETQSITVGDIEAPMLDASPMDVTVCVGNVPPMVSLNWTDNCDGNGSVSGTDMTDGASCPEIITRSWTYTDACGNIATETQSITVGDIEAPMLDASPMDVTVCVGNVPPMVSLNWTDNCDGNGTVSGTDMTDGASCPEIITRSWTYTDACGNTATETQSITVGDSQAPTITGVPIDITVECLGDFNSSYGVIPSLNWTDNCSAGGMISGIQSPDPGTLDCNGGVITRTWSISDDCGNLGMESQTITIDPNPAIVWTSALPADITIDCSMAVPSAIDLNYSNNAVSPNCTNSGTVAASTVGAITTCNTSLSYEWEVIDPCSGVSLSHSQTITLEDTSIPVFSAYPANINFSCVAEVTAADIITVSDNCDMNPVIMFTESSSPDPIGCAGGTITRTWSYTNSCNIEEIHTQLVTVDAVDPIVWTSVVPADVTIDCTTDLSSHPIVNLSYSNNEANPACLESGSNVAPTITGSIVNCGDVETRIWEVTDGCGNMLMASQTITYQDDELPQFVGAPNSITYDCASEVPAIADLNYTDNCLPSGTVAGVETGVIDACDGGSLVREWSVTDECGNNAIHVQNITVNPVPQINWVGPLPQDMDVNCGSSPVAAVDLNYSNGSANSNCLLDGTVVPTETGNFATCGDQLIRTWTITPSCGMELTHTQTLTLIDNEAPVFVAVPGNATYDCLEDVPMMQALDYTDNCSVGGNVNGVEVTMPSPITCDGGTITRTWTIMDDCGNETTEVQTITVNATPPIIWVSTPSPSIEIQCGDAIPTPPELSFSNNATCLESGTSIAMDDGAPLAACGDVRTYTWTETDACNNSISFVQTITIIDTEAPVLSSTPGNITYDCYDDVAIAPTISWTDNCDGTGTATFTEMDDVSDVCVGGMITRSWEYIDACNNSVSHTQTITVLPKPDITWDSEFSDLIVQCGDPIVPFGDLSYSNNASNTNCIESGSVAPMISPPNIMSCGDVQTYTWTVVSSCGTMLSSTATITIVDGEAPTFDNPPPLNQTITCLSDIPATDDLPWSDSCDGTGVVPFVDNGTIDICNGGSITRTWSVTDACGNGPVTASTTFTLVAPVFTACDDGDDCTINDMQKIGCDGVTICVPCAGVLSECSGLVTMVSCDDGDACTENDMRGEACNGEICIPCAGTTVPSCSGVEANIVQSCDDGDPCTINDVLEIDGCDLITVCVPCGGTPNPTSDPTFTQPSPVCENESIIITADPCPGGTLSWLDAPGGVVLTTGSTFTTPNLTSTTSYYLVCNINGCLSNEVEVVVSVSAASVVTIMGDDEICAGQETTVLTATPGFDSYDWGMGPGTDNTLTVSTQGSYAVTVTDVNGCTATASFNVTTNNLPDVNIGGSTSFCAGGNTTISVPAGFTYLWSPNGETTNSINVTTAGTYGVTVTDANGCTDSDEVIVTEQSTLTLNVTGDLNICENESATLDLGTNYPTILWSPGGETTQVITVNPTMTSVYTVEVTDMNGCTGSTLVEVIVNSPVPPTILNAQDICPGESITLDAGTGYIDYTWSDGSLNQTTVISAAGMYSVTVTDGNGCTSSNEVTINEFVPPVPAINGDLSLCPDGTDMTTLTADSGYTAYIWSEGSTTESIIVSTAGTYTVTVTDMNGCTGSSSVMVTLDVAPTVNIAGPASICFGAMTDLDAGSGFVNYLWSDGSGNQILTIMTGGTYSVTVTDNNGCTNSAEITINELSELMPEIVGGLEICPVDGMTSLSLTNAYTSYEWTGGLTSSSIIVSTIGSYVVTVTDAFGCTGSSSVEVTEYNVSPVDISGATEFCEFSNTTLTADAGFINYIWSNGVGGPTITVNTPNTYTVTATDANGCTSESSVTVTEITTPDVMISGDTEFCDGDMTTLDAGVWESYSWNIGSQTTQTIEVNVSQLAIVTVTDINGCTGTGQVQVTSNNVPTPTITGSSSFCTGSSTTLSTNILYNAYLWSDGSVGASLGVNVAGLYTVTVTDSNGCTGTDEINVTESTALNPTITGPQVVCVGDGITLNAGAGFDTYNWNNGLSTNQTLNVTNAGVYTVVVTDITGCSGSSSLTITEATPVEVDLPTSDFYCQGQNVTIDAGAGFVSYNWSNSFNTQTITVGTAGIYSVTTTDINGCTSSDEITISEAAAPTPVFISGDQYCPGEAMVLELMENYSDYVWNTGETSATISVNTSGLYSVTVTDAQGCEGNTSITITSFPTVDPTIGGSTSFCPGGFTILDAGSYSSYSWSTTETTQTIQVSAIGNYMVTVTDANGCTGVDMVDITIQTSLNPVITGNLEFCQGGFTSLNAGSGFSDYLWNDPNSSTTQFINISTPGDYTVIVSDASGCSGSATVSVTELAQPPLTIEGGDSFCEGEDVIISATSGYILYSWFPSGNSTSITVDEAGQYGVTVTDINGCTNSAVIEMVEIPEPMVSVIGDPFYCQNETTTIDVGSWNTVIWSTGENTSSIDVGSSGLYTVTVTDDNNCSSETSINIAPYPNVDVTITGSTAFCAGGITTLGADNIFDFYEWSGPLSGTGSTIEVNVEGDYTLVVTDSNGCTASETVSVTLQTSLSPTITGDTELCEGATGILDAGSAFAMYEWSGPGISGTSSTIMISEAGTYNVTVEDASGCTGTDEIEVIVNTNPTPVIQGQSTYCQGSSTLLTVGGFAQYNWSTGNTGTNIQVGVPGEVFVTVTDANSCTGIASIEITEVANPVPVITGDPSFCPGEFTNLDVGSNWSEVQWSTGEMTSSIQANIAQVYSVTVTDNNLCMGVASVNVSAYNVDPVTIGGSSSYCIGSSTILDAGSQFIDWTWSTGESGVQTVEISTEGNVSVTVTDVNGCMSTGSIDVTEETSLLVNILGNTEICEGESTVLDGGGAFGDWSWSTGESGVQIITVTTEGLYTVTVSDIDGGCTGTGEITVMVNEAPNPEIIGDTELCPGDNSTLSLSNVYSEYLWSDGTALPTIIAATGGFYSVTVTDNNGCTSSDQIEVTQNGYPSVVSISTMCSDEMDTYDIFINTDGDSVDSDIAALVIDNNDGSFSIVNIDTISSVMLTITNSMTGCDTTFLVDSPDCSCQVIADAGMDGVLTCVEDMVELGGSQTSTGFEYTYEWYNDQNTLVGTDLTLNTNIPGQYTLIVYNTVDNCEDSSSTLVADNTDEPAAVIFADPSTTFDCIISSITLSTIPEDNVIYTWNLPNQGQIEGTEINVDMEMGISLIALDTLNGCTNQDFVDLTDLVDFPIILFEEIQMLDCDTDFVIIDASNSQSSPDITYQWYDISGQILDGEIFNELNVTQEGLYIFESTDAITGCINQDTVEVISNIEYPNLTLDDSAELNCIDGFSTLLGNNDLPDLNAQILWSTLDGSINSNPNMNEIEVGQPGVYYYQVTNISNQCSSLDSIVVAGPSLIEMVEVVAEDPDCLGDASGSIAVPFIQGGTGPFSYFINGVEQDTELFENLTAGTYDIEIVDFNGCNYMTSLQLENGSDVSLDINETFYTVDAGDSIQILLEVLPDFDATLDTLIWSPEAQLSCNNCLDPWLTVESSQSYMVSLIDMNGCTSTIGFSVVVDDSSNIFFPNIFNPFGGGNNRGFTGFAGDDIEIILDLKVYDRWGELIFVGQNLEPGNISQGWDGTFKGEYVEQGVYVFVAEYLGSSGSREVQSGDLTFLKSE